MWAASGEPLIEGLMVMMTHVTMQLSVARTVYEQIADAITAE